MKNMVIFALGCVCGGMSVYLYLNDRCDRRIHEEVEEISRSKKEATAPKETKEDLDAEYELQKKKAAEARNKPMINNCAKMVKEKGYVSYDKISTDKTKEPDVIISEAPLEESTDEQHYAVSPEDFGEYPDYEQITFYHTADGRLVNESDELVDPEEVEDMIGMNYADHFGEFEDDSVFIRNDKYRTDFEILKTLKTYTEIENQRNHIVVDPEELEEDDEE